jgi:inorganic triphosphatase YgiF
MEIEAKFLVQDPVLLEEVARITALGPFRRIRTFRQRQRNTYLDTPDLLLKRAKAVLKLRQVAAARGGRTRPGGALGRRAELTFKSEVGHDREISRRLELTVPIPIRHARSLIGFQPLKRLFTLHTDRRRMIFAFGKQRIELDLDRVTVRKGRRIAGRRYEVEVENLSASPTLYRQALTVLRRTFGRRLRPSRIWKGEYAWEILSK